MTDDEIAAVRKRRAELLTKWDALQVKWDAYWAEWHALQAEFDCLPRIVINHPQEEMNP